MRKTQKISAGEKSAHVTGKYSTRNQIIAGTFLVAGIFFTWMLTSSSNRNKDGQKQEVREQKVDTGSINNYNAGRDIKIENNTYNGTVRNIDSTESSRPAEKHVKAPITNNQKTNIHEQTNVTSNNQSGGQTAKEIINNNN